MPHKRKTPALFEREQPRRKLFGIQAECCACKRIFNSPSAFDKHRKGDFPDFSRICMTEEEMLAAQLISADRGDGVIVWKSNIEVDAKAKERFRAADARKKLARHTARTP